MFFLFLVSISLCSVISVYPEPWPTRVFVAYSQNATDPKTGELQNVESHLKAYDWNLSAHRDECYSEGSDSAMVFLLVQKKGYIFDAQETTCIQFDFPFGGISRDWFAVDSTFQGFHIVGGIEVALWNKLDHLYYTSAKDFSRPGKIDF